MMMPRNKILLLTAILLLLAGIVLLTFQTQEGDPVPIFPAAVDRDCAPWDGPAFTVSIPIEEQVIKISIYQSPDIRRTVTFSFPGETMRDGNAMLLLPVGLPEQLRGKVYFQRVEQGATVHGKFDLATGTGQQFKGIFTAEWGNETVYCG